MEATTTVQGMLRGNRIVVPDYQRAYAWVDKHVKRFVMDLDDFLNRKRDSATCYYLGHFLFERRGEREFAVIDGQQRLTTTVLCLAALFRRIKQFREWSDDELDHYEDMICRRGKFAFETVEADRSILRDCLEGKVGAEDEVTWGASGRRVAKASRNFDRQFASIDERRAVALLDALRRATCTTHCVANTGEAAQMFLLQNDRGKDLTRLEVAKAMLLRTLYLGSQGEVRETAVERVNDHFKTVYANLACLEGHIENEDEVLACAWKVAQKDLCADSSTSAIENTIKQQGENGAAFVQAFAETLRDCTQKLVRFYRKERASLPVQTLRCRRGRIGVYAWGYPFIVQAYTFLDGEESRRERVWAILESLTVRHLFGGGRAQMEKRLQGTFADLSREMDRQMKDLLDIVAKGEFGFWYWSDGRLREILAQPLANDVARFSLWRYDTSLPKQDEALLPDLGKLLSKDESDREHIAPQNCLNDGYDNAREGYGEFSVEELNLLGNTLILPPSPNRSLQDESFQGKYGNGRMN